jgi:hypothetical protein
MFEGGPGSSAASKPITGEGAFLRLITRMVRANCVFTLGGASRPYCGASRIAKPFTISPS